MGGENMHNYMIEDKKLRHIGAQASTRNPARSSWTFRRDILSGLLRYPLSGFIHLQLKQALLWQEKSWWCQSSVAVGR